jgi:hypothetical protein
LEASIITYDYSCFCCPSFPFPLSVPFLLSTSPCISKVHRLCTFPLLQQNNLRGSKMPPWLLKKQPLSATIYASTEICDESAGRWEHIILFSIEKKKKKKPKSWEKTGANWPARLEKVWQSVASSLSHLLRPWRPVNFSSWLLCIWYLDGWWY